MAEEITLEHYLMGREHTHKEEYSEKIGLSAEALLIRVNGLLASLRLPEAEHPKLTSGWRPPTLNATIKGAVKRSHHTTGHAIDLHDPHGRLGRFLAENEPLLAVFGLYLESPSATPTWVHLQDIPPKSGKRVFRP